MRSREERRTGPAAVLIRDPVELTLAVAREKPGELQLRLAEPVHREVGGGRECCIRAVLALEADDHLRRIEGEGREGVHRQPVGLSSWRRRCDDRYTGREVPQEPPEFELGGHDDAGCRRARTRATRRPSTAATSKRQAPSWTVSPILATRPRRPKTRPPTVSYGSSSRSIARRSRSASSVARPSMR